MPRPFLDAIRRLAVAAPERPSLTVGEVTLTRAELVAAVERVAAVFAERGVGEGSWVTLVLPNGIEFVEAALAAWLLGATPQPISRRLPNGERAAIIALADPALVVVAETDGAAESAESAETAETVEAPDAARRPTLTAADITRVANDPSAPRHEDAAVTSPEWKVVTSGGSTGRPKLIVATSPADAEALVGLGTLLRLRPDGATLVTGPMSHNAPYVAMIAALLLGNHVVVMPRFDAAETLRLVERHGIDWLYLVPTMMLRIWRLPEQERLGYDLSSLRVAFHMAAPCAPWLKSEWIGWLGPEKILELYGGTELQAMTVITGTEWLEHEGSVGKAVIGEIECRDPDGAPLPPRAVGELWMRRGGAAAIPYRYVGASAKSAGDNWESLGDIGFLDEDGYVYVTDRDTDMILVGGENVYPAEIEAALDEHPAVRSSCVIGLPDDELGAVPHALVELGADVTDGELLAHVRTRLEPIKIPRSIERVDSALRDDAGKVRRSALRAERVRG
jgi:bile acid-coenzyme A ligase